MEHAKAPAELVDLLIIIMENILDHVHGPIQFENKG